MVTYSRPIQFVTSDDLYFITSDNLNFIVGGDGDYFTDTTNTRENLNIISFGNYTFGGSKIKTLKLHFESGLFTDQLAIDTLTAEIVSDTKPILNRYTPITVRRDGNIIGVFFNGVVKEVGKKRYSIYAESYISLLDYDYHYGGVYTGTNTGTIVAQIMGSIPYTIHSDVAAIKIYGYLPFATKRENLLQILIATGAMIERNTDGTINITVLTGSNTGILGNERVFVDGSLKEDTQVTAVKITEHAYTPITDTTTLLAESFTDIKLITFSEPYHDLICTNGTILESGANYAKIQGAGAVTLTGKKYRHTTRIVTKGTVLNTPADKVVSVTNATLITALNSTSVAQRLYKYTSCNKSIDQDVLINQERTGKLVQVVHPYSTDYLSAAIKSLDFNLSNTLKASGEFLVNYEPQGITEGYKNRVLLNTNGNWTVPTGVTEIRVVLISGGQGGTSGENGTSGSNGTNSNSYSRGTGGKGGKAGVAGQGGKIYETTITVTSGQVITRTIGQGGINGNLGTATIFGTYSSESGVVGEYIDAMTAERFAYAGTNGINGADGQGASGSRGGDVTDLNGTLYTGGYNGSVYTENIGGSTGVVGGRGGGGSGAAVGSNGINGGDARVGSDSTAYGGNGANGVTPIKPVDATIYGVGGDGGHGGSGGGGGGDSYHKNSDYSEPGHGGSAGAGGTAAKGASGCVIIYY